MSNDPLVSVGAIRLVIVLVYNSNMVDYSQDKGWTTKDTAIFLGVSRTFVLSLITRKKIKAKKNRFYWVVDPTSAKEYKNKPKDVGGRGRFKKEIKSKEEIRKKYFK